MTLNRRLLAAVGIAVLLAVTGCSSSNNKGNTDTAGDRNPAAGAGGTDERAAPQADANQAPGQAPNAKAPVFDRSIIKTGQITIRVEHVSTVSAQIRSLATGSGGFVGSEKSSGGAGSQEQSTITLRIPADKFDSILDQLAKFGTELDRSVSTDDVTDQVADLDAQIAATRTSVDSVRRLLAQAKDLNQILLLEKELTSRQASLDSLVAKKRRLDDLVTLSTITASLIGPTTPYVEPTNEDPSFLGGLRAGWDTFVIILKVAAAVIGFLLPFLVVLALVGVPLLWWVRRRRRPIPPPPPVA
jgi:hypothetical protein